MSQIELLEPPVKQDGHFDLGKGYSLHLPRGPRFQGDLYYRGRLSKRVNLADKVERRILVVDLLAMNINQTRLAEVLNLSRQTLHNYRECHRMFGMNGLLHGYSPGDSQSEERQRRRHVGQRRPGSKARELEALRRAQMAQTQGATQDELAWDDGAAAIYTREASAIEAVLGAGQIATEAIEAIEGVSDVAPPPAEGRPETLDPPSAAPPAEQTSPAPAQAIDLPQADNHGWIASRYAGLFPVLMVLVSQGLWMQRLFRLFGNGWRLFMVFALMMVRNIRSIEQLKHERREEAGRLLGLARLPGVDTLWGRFHDVASQRRSPVLLKAFFAEQIRGGLVGARLWFTDGHLLPYTGQDKVHAARNTPRRMPVPGQTNLVTCDEQGRVVYFDIQEGKGDLRAQVLKLGEQARQQLPGTPPVHVFDREGTGLEFFSDLVRSRTPFITWEKSADKARLMALPAADFTGRVRVNGTDYRLLEQTRTCNHPPEADPDTAVDPPRPFELRRVVLWNLRTGHRISVLCWSGELDLPQEMVVASMPGRWGASENTFKHIKARHPYHYHPGFAMSQSEKQDIANPQIKALAQQISTAEGNLAKLYKRHAKTKPGLNQDGSERTNSLHRRLTEATAKNEAELKRLKSDKALLPERVDVAGLANYRSFKAIDNEGKNLFDFVTASVWNARRQLVDWLADSYAKDSDRVDLLQAIFNCQGWIRSDDRWVVVRMEPLQQPTRRYAQEQLCRKLTGLGARIPGGKWLRVEVGESPV